MTHSPYTPEDTALLLIDPYNDFLSEGGKLFGLAQAVIEANRSLDHMKQIVAAARASGITVFYVPHHRARLTDFAGWKQPSPYQLGSHRMQVFAEGSWGAEWHPDFIPQAGDPIVREHWNSSGFANTDLDIHLTQRGVQKLVLIGMLANTCLETTGKFGVELGYHVTLVRDATAAFSPEAMQVAHAINGPTYAHAILTTQELLAGFPAAI